MAATDSQRELTERGNRDAQKAGQILAGLSWQPDRVLVSPYVRAQQTSAACLRAFNNSFEIETVDWLVPDTPLTVAIEQLQAYRDECLQLVSHQPLVSRLLGFLIAGEAHAGPGMMPASMALLDTDLPLAGMATLRWLRHAPEFTAKQF